MEGGGISLQKTENTLYLSTGFESPISHQISADLAVVCCAQGRYRWEDTEDLGLDILDQFQSSMGGNLFPILQEEGQLAHVYSVIGRSGDAEDLYMSSLRRCKLVSLSEHHPLTRRVMDGLAIIYRGQGRWKEAKDIEVRILNTLRNVLGDIHSEPLRAMANLTTTYWTVGRVTEADALGEQLLLSLKKERSDVDILNDLENLCIYPDVARWRTQSKVLTQVLSIHKTEFGDNHANTFAALSNLSSTYRCQGRWKDSAEFEEQIVSGFTNVLGKDHPYIRGAMDRTRDVDVWRRSKTGGLGVAITRWLIIPIKTMGLWCWAMPIPLLVGFCWISVGRKTISFAPGIMKWTLLQSRWRLDWES